MDSDKKILAELKRFILSQNNIDYGDKYWLSVIKGLKYLFLLKASAKDKDSVMNSFYRIREEVLNETDNAFTEDFVDELNAILIQNYPMPDFWNSTILDFKEHVNFKRYFELLDQEHDNIK